MSFQVEIEQRLRDGLQPLGATHIACHRLPPPQASYTLSAMFKERPDQEQIAEAIRKTFCDSSHSNRYESVDIDFDVQTLGGPFPIKVAAFVFVKGLEPEVFAALSRSEMADVFTQLLAHVDLELVRENNLRQGSCCRVERRRN